MSRPGNGASEARPGLVIFDLDGVLVDSERLSFRTLCEALAEHGVALDPDETLRRFLGRRDVDIYRTVEEEAGRALPPHLGARRHALLMAAIPRELRPVAGAREVLDGLAGPRCVASNSGDARVRLSLQAAGLADCFAREAVFTGDMVERGKPAPDLFLLAAERMGVSRDACVVVEDSPSGVQAALAAGMTVLGFAGVGHVAPELHGRTLAEAGVAAVFTNLADLPGLLTRYGH